MLEMKQEVMSGFKLKQQQLTLCVSGYCIFMTLFAQVYACESLLDQVQELRMHVVLQDMPEIASELREERKDLNKR